MITSINNVQFFRNIPKFSQVENKPQISYINNDNKTDTVSFAGKSAPSMYSSVFEYLAAEILAGSKKYNVDGSMLSAKKIKITLNELLNSDKIFETYKKTVAEKIKWKSYIPQDIRTYSVDKINEARAARMTDWEGILKNPKESFANGIVKDKKLATMLEKDKSLRLVIWNAITSELKENNRHIPVPFNEKALLETISGFEKIEPKDRAVRCASPSFLDIYTHRLRDNLLMELGLSDNQAVWVKVPSISHDTANKSRNIERLEILSCRNWCTRSSVDKAEDALKDGDFYVYLERGKSNLWEPRVGMALSRGKIDQIQGVDNNNIVPLNLLDEIKSFIKESKLKCHSGVIDEGPKATQAILISEKLSEVKPNTKRTFDKAIKDRNALDMLEFLGVKVNQLDDGLLEIGTYRPSYNLNADSGLSVPYSMFGLNEDDLLESVKVINGNLILDNVRNTLFNSRITKFPPNLEAVTGRISCTASQYERFASDIDRLVGGNKSKLIIHKD